MLRILAGLISILATSFVLWATWATVTLFVVQRDLAVMKAANHLAAGSAEHKAEAPVLAEPGFGGIPSRSEKR
jgi:hypothetical protein